MFQKLFVIVLFTNQLILGQVKTEVTNVDFTNDGSLLFINYDLSSSGQNDKCYVWCEVYANFSDKQLAAHNIQSYSQKINAASFTGDIGEIKPGSRKTIIWDFRKDKYVRNDNIQVKIIATSMPEIEFGKRFLKSSYFPGLGSYELTHNKSNLILGIVGYGLTGSSILLYQKANSTYDIYKKNPTPSQYNKVANQKNTALYLIGGSLTTWLLNYILFAYQSHKIQSRVANTQLFEDQNGFIIATSKIKALYDNQPTIHN